MPVLVDNYRDVYPGADVTDADLLAAIDADATATMRELAAGAPGRDRQRGEFTAADYAVERGLTRDQVRAELNAAIADGRLTRRRGIENGTHVWWYHKR